MLEIILHVVLELERGEELQDLGTQRDLEITGHHPPPPLSCGHPFKASRRMSFRGRSHHTTSLSKLSTGFPLLLE